MPFSFIREENLRHSREVVEQNLARYQPLNYNRFMWWRSHTDGIKPLSKRVTLKERIVNGDYNESSYYMQAQLALHNAKDKVDLNIHNHSDQLDILASDLTGDVLTLSGGDRFIALNGGSINSVGGRPASDVFTSSESDTATAG